MSWWIKVFSYFELKVFFEIMSQDKNYFKKICEKIMCHFYNIKNRNINNRNCISNFLNLYPRISFFTLDNIIITFIILFITTMNYKKISQSRN